VKKIVVILMNIDLKPGSVFLLPHTFNRIGLVLFFPSLILSYFFAFAGIKPAFLDVYVFAVWSEYFQTKYFSIIENNISEEITLLLLLISLFFIACAKVAGENEATLVLRFKAMMLAIYTNTILLIVSIVFIYGIAFLSIVFLNLFSGLLLFIVIFYFNYFRYRSERNASPQHD
jgi:hypothetical protein